MQPNPTFRLALSIAAAALLHATARAQCHTPPSPASQLVPVTHWDGFSGYASLWDIDDESLSSPPVALTAFASFPMAGAAGTLDQLWIGSNAEIYLTDSSLALTEPVGPAEYGINGLAELRGSVPGASARIAVLGNDQKGSEVPGANWTISIDQSVAGEVRIVWRNLSRYLSSTDRYSVGCTLFANGDVQLDYTETIGAPEHVRYVGISIGDAVGTTGSPSMDLTGGADSGAVGLGPAWCGWWCRPGT